jgi:2-haloacid dehalogenase
MTARYQAVLFDLLTALLDSWSLWNAVAGDADSGARWRAEYLRRTYAAGAYVPYEELVAAAAHAQGLDSDLAEQLTARWEELQPWPEAPAVLAELARSVKIGVVTNCSDSLGARAAQLLRVDFDVIVTAQSAGAYKPRPEPYRQALEALDVSATEALFVVGSKYDIPGAGGVGMPVWWHNRIRMDRGDLPAPLAEHDSLTPLPDDVLSE